MTDDLKTWRMWLENISSFYHQGEKITRQFPEEPSLAPCGKTQTGGIVLCAPHPDDEAIAAPLALRLAASGVPVHACALTLGSDTRQQKRRQKEFAASCAVLEFLPVFLESLSTSALTELLHHVQPDLVLCPHADDRHPTHEKTHRLTMDAAHHHCLAHRRDLLLCQWEYWHPMRSPNLLFGISLEEGARIMTALCRHAGEIQRNPYHLRLPGRWLDTVRRAGELVCGLGQPPPDMLFADALRVSRMTPDGEKQSLVRHLLFPDAALPMDLLQETFFPA